MAPTESRDESHEKRDDSGTEKQDEKHAERARELSEDDLDGVAGGVRAPSRPKPVTSPNI
jgi:hypothetical protein